MADPDMDEDLFADLYDGEDVDATPAAKVEPDPVRTESQNDSVDPVPVSNDGTADNEFDIKTEAAPTFPPLGFGDMQGVQSTQQQNGGFGFAGDAHSAEHDRPVSIKEDG